MNKLRIGIIGTRGIPNHYGGFEYFAQHLSKGLVERGHEVFVYNSHNHPYQLSHWNGVHIVHCYDPEHKLGSFGQFIYDFHCIRDARTRHYDILLFLGYTSSTVWYMLYPDSGVIIYNMDGLEWKRSKYAAPVRLFLKYAEKLAVRHSHFLIADSLYIKRYIHQKYHKTPHYIAYGAHVFNDPNEQIITDYGLLPRSYNMVMARMEPENNIEMILQGYQDSRTSRELIVVGNTNNRFGRYLQRKFASCRRIRFLGAIFNSAHINNLIYFSNVYFHGHSVGGTNPSLLEAMGCRALIVARKNIFNRAVLKENAYYFADASEITYYANTLEKSDKH